MSQYRPLSAVVLAAGEGTRMRSGTPKVLHPLCGRPMLLHVVDALAELPLERIVIVVGHGAERVTKTLQEQLVTEVPVEFVEQRVQQGTGDAVSVALGVFDDLDAEDDILVLPGDTPLLRAETLAFLATEHRVHDAAATILTARLADPSGYGRVVRDKNDRVSRVVEHVDAAPDERAIDEVNTSIYCIRRNLLAPALRRITPVNAQGEYYLTDALEVLSAAGHRVIGVMTDDPAEALGVNDRAQLAEAEAELRARINRQWMTEGVTMVDPSRTYIDATVELEPEVRLLPGVILEGRTTVGAGAIVGPDCHLVDTHVGERAIVRSTVARDADIGEGTKVPHLSYVGDTEIGENANLGASTITANYDGREKHRTTIGDGVHTGVHTSLVAPVEVGDGAETGAGSVVTRDVPPGQLVKGSPARVARPVREDDD